MDVKTEPPGGEAELAHRERKRRAAAEHRALAGHTENCPMDPCALIASCQIQRLKNELAVARAQVRAARAAVKKAAHFQGDYSLCDQLARGLLDDISQAGKPRPRVRGIR